jgi:putative FmdB family regulatory protein
LPVPVYEYACTECGERLEVRQSFTDEPLTVCPACAGRLRKVLSAVGVVFKGSGFYRTDSRAHGQGGEASKESASVGAGESGTAASESSPSSTPSAAKAGASTRSGSSDSGSGAQTSGGSSGAKAAS